MLVRRMHQLFKDYQAIKIIRPGNALIKDYYAYGFKYDYPLFHSLNEAPTQAVLSDAFAHIYTEAALASISRQRLSETRLLVRGDNRSPEEIYEQKGLYPRTPLRAELTAKTATDNISRHRCGHVEGTGLVSFTDKVSVARSAFFIKGWIYIVKAQGAISPAANLEHEPHAEEREYSVPGGVSVSNLVGFREYDFARIQSYTASIYLHHTFIQTYPKLVAPLVRALLHQDEQVAEPEQLQRNQARP